MYKKCICPITYAEVQSAAFVDSVVQILCISHAFFCIYTIIKLRQIVGHGFGCKNPTRNYLILQF